LELEAREVSAASGRDHRRISTAFSKNSQSIMADHLAQIFGTEKDRVNCPFYFKIGTVAGLGRVVCCVSCVVCCVLPRSRLLALHHSLSARCTLHDSIAGSCRHGDRCSRLHNKPTISQTVLLQNIYMNPVLNAPLGPDGLPLPVDPKRVQHFFEDFYEDLFLELDKYGTVENLCVCDNVADHMVGNVYVKYRDEESAAKAVKGLQGRYYAGKPIQVEFSPVTDFKESTCRQYEEGTCNRGGYCNFMHVRPVSRELRLQCFGRYGDGMGGSTQFHGRHGGYRRDRDYRDRRDRDYRGDRDYRDRRDRDRDYYGRRDDRDRDYDDRRGRRYDYGRDRDAQRSPRRDDSAERRARIAQWNKEAAGRD